MRNTGPKFSARLRRAKFYERGATELASEFLNCTETLADFQLLGLLRSIFYDNISKTRKLAVVVEWASIQHKRQVTGTRDHVHCNELRVSYVLARAW